ncbi:MAG: anthranilate synthase component I family protein [Leptospirales bacterium]
MTEKQDSIMKSTLQSFRTLRNVSWDPVSILAFVDRDPQMPKIVLDRRETLGWSFIPWVIDSVLESDGLDPCHSIESILRAIRIPPAPGPLPHTEIVPPFQSGHVMLIPFEWGEQFEPSLGPHSSRGIPMILAHCREIISYHHPSRTLFLPPGCPYQPSPKQTPPRQKPPKPIILEPSLSLQEYALRVEHIQDAIGRGDYFQLNFAMTFDGSLEGAVNAPELYESLSRVNPSPGMGFFSWGSLTIVSNSPERLATIRHGKIITTPIAGTFPSTPEETDPTSKFLSDPKEKAEHIMTVDLLRNDLGRICLPGTIELPRLLAVERYAHLYHLVSDIRGTLRPSLSAWELLGAIFPGGSVTGAPKRAVRKEIGLLEEKPRRYYCGSLGFLGDSGFWDLNLLIRTLFINGNRLSLPVGSGIVSDSDPRREYREIQAKARTFLERLGSSHD